MSTDLANAENLVTLGGIRLGRIVGVNSQGTLLVDFPDNPFGPLPALSTVTLLREMLNVEREVLLAFAENDPQQPIVVGLVQQQAVLATPQIGRFQPQSPLEVTADGQRLTVTAYSELQLRCGAGSITLRRDGKIVIEGTSILSRAKVCNRIKGGSVQIN